jgi:fluoroacetyl-CoA thioesterase
MASITHVVGPEHAAPALGSGDVPVFATPMLVAWCEEATCAALPLEATQTSVGTRVSIEHLVASPVGATVTATAEIIARDGRLVTFRVEAVDDSGALIGSGEVRRVIVERDRFLARLRQL